MLPRFAAILLLLGVGVSACSGTSSDAGSGSTSAGASQAGSSSSAGTSSSGGTSSSAGTSSGGSPPVWQPSWQACEADTDCVVIPIQTCCGCVSTGIHRDYAAQGLASNSWFYEFECPPLGCATQGCAADARAACEMGTCVPKPGCSERTEQECESDGTCEKYSARRCGSSTPEFSYFMCGKTKGVCDEAITCVIDYAGLSVQFPNSCLPDGLVQPCPGACN